MSPSEAKQKLTDKAAALNLTLTAAFVPYSQSRHAKDKGDSGYRGPCLNWRVTLSRNGREIFTTDYSAGVGHIPKSLRQDASTRGHLPHYQVRACEVGRYIPGLLAYESIDNFCRGIHAGMTREIPAPELADVLYSLLMDSDVLNCSGFEDWASNLGFDTDSRKAESIYRECLEQALKLRAAIGQESLDDLAEIAREM